MSLAPGSVGVCCARATAHGAAFRRSDDSKCGLLQRLCWRSILVVGHLGAFPRVCCNETRVARAPLPAGNLPDRAPLHSLLPKKAFFTKRGRFSNQGTSTRGIIAGRYWSSASRPCCSEARRLLECSHEIRAAKRTVRGLRCCEPATPPCSSDRERLPARDGIGHARRFAATR
jgi:hypothetical protein